MSQIPPLDANSFAGPSAEVRPTARWFWIGGGIIVLGIVGAIAWFALGLVGISNTVDDFQRVTSDGGSVSIDSSGEFVIYNEDGALSGNVAVTSPGGEPVATVRYSGDLTYDFGGKSGQAVSTFQATTPGVYAIQTDTRIAIGPSIAGDLVRTIVAPFAIGGVTFVLGLIVIIVTAVKRSGSKTRASSAR